MARACAKPSVSCMLMFPTYPGLRAASFNLRMPENALAAPLFEDKAVAGTLRGRGNEGTGGGKLVDSSHGASANGARPWSCRQGPGSERRGRGVSFGYGSKLNHQGTVRF